MLGTSLSGNVNVEFMAFKRPKSFVNIQVGFGIISQPNDVYLFSQVITYTYWLNQRNNVRRRDCQPEKKERKADYFVEFGIYNMLLARKWDGNELDYVFPVLGLRAHFPLRRKSVIFAKIRYIPLTAAYVHQSAFGIALGVSL